ncbi:hypothetical protein CABS01_08911 [Colletotrichum abscissum]|uniref:Uncharacterized protein n=2 Tax=Colletotrichum acutatum species complex TaxID=2707335 RepID=A0AAI9Z720_9PEZI|nr:uncharacterized protein CCOS01_01975 [Colletotrichum costaricense]XP_060383848.1 uncharacterized protein CTAM01_05604 [Colletotrichum tamarilloi]XP_060400550.1 uncharacterized protein CABS01_08911 [Colletotrichum abscissum]KAK1502166.1 hypothetical protein CTAM01_05604 [Colletotrichum tamarilloi]KAK1503522.1 hypothetical protein CABS01_08911 [Colletotrichum abscissum]KAK1536655.1 hypothetical protein CCOS01_01975 [Colletotrichum costaricense]
MIVLAPSATLVSPDNPFSPSRLPTVPGVKRCRYLAPQCAKNAMAVTVLVSVCVLSTLSMAALLTMLARLVPWLGSWKGAKFFCFGGRVK